MKMIKKYRKRNQNSQKFSGPFSPLILLKYDLYLDDGSLNYFLVYLTPAVLKTRQKSNSPHDISTKSVPVKKY
jgi:hypothetical protein